MSDQSSQERERINNFVDVQGIRGIALPSSIGRRRAKRNSETESNEYAMSPPTKTPPRSLLDRSGRIQGRSSQVVLMRSAYPARAAHFHVIEGQNIIGQVQCTELDIRR